MMRQRWERAKWSVLMFTWLLVTAWLIFLVAVVPARAETSGCEQEIAHPHRCASVLVLGHRGQGGLNEDTMFALRHDHAAGVGFEADTWTSTDGVSFVFHDVYPKRMIDPASYPPGVTDHTRMDAMTWAQVQQLRTRVTGRRVPSLQRWIAYSGEHGVAGAMENKYDEVNAPQVAAWIEHYGADKVTFYQTPKCTGRGDQRRVIHAELPDFGVTTGAKMLGACDATMEMLANAGYSYAIMSGPLITRSLVLDAHHYGLEVGNFNSGQRPVWAAMTEAGADIIIAPHPARAQRWLEE